MESSLCVIGLFQKGYFIELGATCGKLNTMTTVFSSISRYFLCMDLIHLYSFKTEFYIQFIVILPFLYKWLMIYCVLIIDRLWIFANLKSCYSSFLFSASIWSLLLFSSSFFVPLPSVCPDSQAKFLFAD